MAHVLVIEDNLANLELMSYLLSAFGHRVATAESGSEGIAKARGEIPDLVLCDVQLPDADGYGVVRTFKADEALRAIPVVAVTALTMVGDREKGLAGGFSGYIAKPIDPEKFVEQIEAFLPSTQRGSAPQRDTEPEAACVQARQVSRAIVLVVDDSATNRELIFQTLTPFGYDVRLAATVAAGLQLAAETTPDMILSDLHMPGEDGFNLIRRVRADPRLACLPFLFISSSVWGENDRATAVRLGVTQFLLRPIEPQNLLDEVQRCLAACAEISHGNDTRR